jgi:hypothetical protein
MAPAKTVKRKRVKFSRYFWYRNSLPKKKEIFEWKKLAGIDNFYKVAEEYSESLLNIYAKELSFDSEIKRCFFCKKQPVIFELFEKLESWHVIVPSKDIICPTCLDDLKLLEI